MAVASNRSNKQIYQTFSATTCSYSEISSAYTFYIQQPDSLKQSLHILWIYITALHSKYPKLNVVHVTPTHSSCYYYWLEEIRIMAVRWPRMAKTHTKIRIKKNSRSCWHVNRHHGKTASAKNLLSCSRNTCTYLYTSTRCTLHRFHLNTSEHLSPSHGTRNDIQTFFKHYCLLAIRTKLYAIHIKFTVLWANEMSSKAWGGTNIQRYYPAQRY